MPIVGKKEILSPRGFLATTPGVVENPSCYDSKMVEFFYEDHAPGFY
jgi:hypothetical protein